MSARFPYAYLCVVLILVVEACAPSQLSASCRAAPFRTTWTTTPNVGRIEGEVRDQEYKIPIGNLEIRLVDLDRHQRTDGQGAFRFDAVPEGRHVLVAEGNAYPARGDTLILLPESGARGALVLATNRDVLTHCPIYHP